MEGTLEEARIAERVVYRALQGEKQVGWVIPATGQGFADKVELLIGADLIDQRVGDETVSDIALRAQEDARSTYWVIDKVRLYGPPRWKEESETAIGAGNPVKFWAYVFLPRNLEKKGKLPLLVFPHGGVHSDFSTYYTHIVRELMAQGYAVIAPEYRGSTGYGRPYMLRLRGDWGVCDVDDATPQVLGHLLGRLLEALLERLPWERTGTP